jgi:hypothetical protein
MSKPMARRPRASAAGSRFGTMNASHPGDSTSFKPSASVETIGSIGSVSSTVSKGPLCS